MSGCPGATLNQCHVGWSSSIPKGERVHRHLLLGFVHEQLLLLGALDVVLLRHSGFFFA